MIPYKNLGGDSNVVAYETGDGYIKVQFRPTGRWYLYTYTNMSAGSLTIQQMQRLAAVGQGLNSFISRNNPVYSQKI